MWSPAERAGTRPAPTRTDNQVAAARLSREEREGVVVACQFSARTAAAAERELAGVLRTLDTDYLDVPTLVGSCR